MFDAATAALAFSQLRLRRTQRQVSARYLERYVRADAFLWREMLRVPKGTTAAEERAELAMAVMRRCMHASLSA